MWWDAVLGLAAGLLLTWTALVATLYAVGRHHGARDKLTDLLRVLPDVLRLIRRLAADEKLPRGVRLRLVLLIGYLVFPLDLVPDFVPVVGYADDAVIVAIALRSVTRAAGAEALDRHWQGTPGGLVAVKRLAGVDS